MGVAKRTMSQLNEVIADLLMNIMDEARKLTLFSKKSTLSSKEIESSCKLLFKGELQKHAINEGRKAITKFVERDAAV
jgi:histone H2B